MTGSTGPAVPAPSASSGGRHFHFKTCCTPAPPPEPGRSPWQTPRVHAIPSEPDSDWNGGSSALAESRPERSLPNLGQPRGVVRPVTKSRTFRRCHGTLRRSVPLGGAGYSSRTQPRPFTSDRSLRTSEPGGPRFGPRVGSDVPRAQPRRSIEELEDDDPTIDGEHSLTWRPFSGRARRVRRRRQTQKCPILSSLVGRAVWQAARDRQSPSRKRRRQVSASLRVSCSS